MQDVSATLDAAIASPVREPLHRAVATWGTSYDDITKLIESVSINKNINTDLPDEARLVSGPAASECVIRMAGRTPSEVKPSQLFAPDGGYITQRVSVPLDIDLGFRTTTGDEYIDAFEGRVRSIDVTDDGTATLVGLDGPDTLRKNVTLPVFLANDALTPTKKYGLDAGWVMDYIARANGFYQTPPVRSSCRLSVPFTGSAYPEVGTAFALGDYISLGLHAVPIFAPMESGSGLFLEAHTNPSGYVSEHKYRYTLSSPINPGDEQDSIFVELFRVKHNAEPAANVQLFSLRSYTGVGGTGGVNATDISVDIRADGQMWISYGRGNAGDNQYSGFTVTENVEHYIAFSLTPTAGGAIWRINLDGATVQVGTAGGTATYDNITTAELTLFTPVVGSTKTMQGVQVTTESYNVNMWNDDFVRSAHMDASLNPLIVTPNVEERDAWNLLQEIASTELGVVLFDEAGVLRFYNRNKFNPSATAVAKVTATTALKSIAGSESIDSVRNVVRVPANPYKPDDYQQLIWQLTETIRVPGSGSYEVFADLPGILISIDTSVTYNSGGPPSEDPKQIVESLYRASQTGDGTGGDVSNLTFAFTQYPSRLKIVISNPNVFDVFLVNNTAATGAGRDFQGTPWLFIAGRLARLSEFQYRASLRNEPSIVLYGEHTTELPETPWRQTNQAAVDLALDLITRLKDPHQVVTHVEIVADPRLQLADKITVVEQDATMINRDFWIIGMEMRYEPGSGVAQSLKLREASVATL